MIRRVRREESGGGLVCWVKERLRDIVRQGGKGKRQHVKENERRKRGGGRMDADVGVSQRNHKLHEHENMT